ncbi:hypothetical protein GCM10008983_20680 [Lentibacillus halophilus]|uniref:Uncharacterized protein n=1 Tax=Lentibacillus halophilus TaxID=295065 RepID=A0ABP3J657_9BACI
MKKQLTVLLITLSLCTIVFMYLWPSNSAPAITYFKEDPRANFRQADTTLQLASQKTKDSYDIMWKSQSESKDDLYLRQDATLLFHNGILRGVKTKWKEQTNTIAMKESITGEDSNYYQAISYHHGEIHHPNEAITSIQEMTDDQLYVIDSPNTETHSFKHAATDYERDWAHLLEHTTEQQLSYSWNQLMDHYGIDKNSYKTVGLTELEQFNQEPLPSFTQQQTNQIIGQLWEGIYKNYVIPFITTESRSETWTSFVPVILFDKQKTHLIVLFEINGEKKKLIQQYPDF